MKKTNIILLVSFILLGTATALYLKQGKLRQQSSLVGWDREFKVKDTNQIYKIFIAQRTTGEHTTLVRKDGYWEYNNQYRVLPNTIENLMRAFAEMEIKYKPADAAVPSMVRDLSTLGIKVELYDKSEKLLKSFYVGGAPSDERGTYMILENSNQPYVVHLPTWEGNLRFRFNLVGEDWRDKTIFAYTPETIQSVSIEYPKQQKESFRLTRLENAFEVTPFDSLTPRLRQPLEQGLVESFLVGFKQIGAEAFETNNPKRDSVLKTLPFTIITLKTTEGTTQQVKLYPLPYTVVETDQAGRGFTKTYVERYFALVNETDFMLVQHRVFEKILWGYGFFFAR